MKIKISIFILVFVFPLYSFSQSLFSFDASNSIVATKNPENTKGLVLDEIIKQGLIENRDTEFDLYLPFFEEDIILNIFHQLWLKPFTVQEHWKVALQSSKYGGLVTDDDYVEGTASSLANELSIASGKVVRTLGLRPRSAGFHPTVDNLPPTAEEIIKYLKDIKNGI